MIDDYRRLPTAEQRVLLPADQGGYIAAIDAEKVGISTKEGPGTFRFDTSIQGNWRNGHEFGTTLSVQQKKDLLEYLKTL